MPIFVSTSLVICTKHPITLTLVSILGTRDRTPWSSISDGPLIFLPLPHSLWLFITGQIAGRIMCGGGWA